MESNRTGSTSDDLSSWDISSTLSPVNLVSSSINLSNRSNRGHTPQSHNWINALASLSIIMRAPLSSFLEYSGLIRSTRYFHPLSQDTESQNEVSIRIISSSENATDSPEVQEQSRDGGTLPESSSNTVETETSNPNSSSGRDNQRYDIQQAARWLEQIFPFSLLLIIVFIRQHFQVFWVSIWITIILFKSNDILRKQAALKEERRVSVLAGASIAIILHVAGIYWWYRNDDLLNPLLLVPPTSSPRFWHAIFIVIVNGTPLLCSFLVWRKKGCCTDTLVRQAAMVVKCLLLIYHRKSRGPTYRKQGQLLTLIEYFVLLYRSLLSTPVWYRFFLNKEYGSLFASLMTGLYLTCKLTYVIDKYHCFFTAVKALSRKDLRYGSYASTEQVNVAGDHCAICQEKMHIPILLRCKHIFCEECVSEWFERERTCPLCRAVVKPADLRSYSEGSTSLLLQIF